MTGLVGVSVLRHADLQRVVGTSSAIALFLTIASENQDTLKSVCHLFFVLLHLLLRSSFNLVRVFSILINHNHH